MKHEKITKLEKTAADVPQNADSDNADDTSQLEHHVINEDGHDCGDAFAYSDKSIEERDRFVAARIYRIACYVLEEYQMGRLNERVLE
jgi:hypothetical protein